MSRFFPHAQFEEDQRYGKTILTTHVLHRGFAGGALIGSVLAPGLLVLQRRRYQQQTRAGAVNLATTTTTTAATARPTLAPLLLRSAGRGALVGTGLSVLAVWGRMRGREAIEWQDRSWRLLANQGQVLVDDFSLAGAAAGLAGGLRAGAINVGWQGFVARAGLGSLAGTAAYMVFQYGIRPSVGGSSSNSSSSQKSSKA